MKTFNEIMKIRDEPDNKPEVTKRKFQVKKTNNEKMQAFGWASVAIAENGETLEDWQGDIIEPEELESAAYKFVDLYREGGEMHERGGVAGLYQIFSTESVVMFLSFFMVSSRFLQTGKHQRFFLLPTARAS